MTNTNRTIEISILNWIRNRYQFFNNKKKNLCIWSATNRREKLKRKPALCYRTTQNLKDTQQKQNQHWNRTFVDVVVKYPCVFFLCYQYVVIHINETCACHELKSSIVILTCWRRSINNWPWLYRLWYSYLHFMIN